jgi:hypothetical protein
MTSSDELDVEMFQWISNIGFSRRRDNKFLNNIDFYYHMKNFGAMIVEARGTQYYK